MIYVFIKSCFKFAIKDSFYRIDCASTLIGVLVPSLYWWNGKPMPETTVGQISFYIGFALLIIVLIRLLVAPYFVWKDETIRLKEAKSHIDKISQSKEWSSSDTKKLVQPALLNRRLELAEQIFTHSNSMKPAIADSLWEIEKEFMAIERDATPFRNEPDFSKFMTQMSFAMRYAWMAFHANDTNISSEQRLYIGNICNSYAQTAGRYLHDLLIGDGEVSISRKSLLDERITAPIEALKFTKNSYSTQAASPNVVLHLPPELLWNLEKGQ